MTTSQENSRLRIRRIAKQLIPPILLEAAERVLAPSRATLSTWEYVPEGWHRQGEIRGWNDLSVVDVIRRDWHEWVSKLNEKKPLSDKLSEHNALMCYGYVLTLASRGRALVSVLDWGGGAGHYYLMSKALLPTVDIDYYVFDVPCVCKLGRDLVPDIHFYADSALIPRKRYTLVLASNSLQYFEDWRSVVCKLSSMTERLLYITGLPVVNDTSSFVVLQRPYGKGYGTEFIGWFLNRKEFLSHVEDTGMELQREFIIGYRPTVHGAPEQGEYRGFLFKPRRA